MRSLARWRLPLAALLLVGLWSSLHHALWAWPADPDLATPWLVWREVLREGPRVLLRWRFAQDNWLLSLLLPDLALFPLTGGSPRVVLLQGWAVFVLSAALLFALLRPVAGPRPAALLAGLLLLAGPPALGHVGFLTYAVSHQVSTLWGLAGLCAACTVLRRGRPLLLLAVLVCQVVGCLSDPWLGAALALPLLLAALLLAALRPDARRRALALAATVALGMVLVRARLLVLHALPGADFVPAPPAAWPARLLWAARCLAAMLHLLPVPLPDPLWLPPPALALPELLPPLAAALWAAGRLWRARRTLAPAHALLALTAALSLLATPAAMTVDAVPLEAGSGRFLGNIMVALPLLLGCAWAAAPRPARLPRAALAAWATLLVLAGLAAAPAELWRLPASLATPRDLALADLLEAHGLHEGYGGYWASGSSAITWITGGRVALRPVRASPPPGSPGPSHVEPRLPQTFPAWFPVAGQPPAAGNRSVFVAQPEAELCPTLPDCLALARRSFGPPDETLQLGPLPILVWNRPVLARPAAARGGRGAPAAPRPHPHLRRRRRRRPPALAGLVGPGAADHLDAEHPRRAPAAPPGRLVGRPRGRDGGQRPAPPGPHRPDRHPLRLRRHEPPGPRHPAPHHLRAAARPHPPARRAALVGRPLPPALAAPRRPQRDRARPRHRGVRSAVPRAVPAVADAAAVGGADTVGSKRFFFEKKKQKTFARLARNAVHVRCQTGKVFLLLFLQKKKTLP